MKKYLIYGTGKSGICAGQLLLRHGANDCIFFDENKAFNSEQFIAKHPEFKDCRFIVGDLDEDTIVSLDEAIISPGVPLSNENVLKIIEAGVEITGELELGYRYEMGRVCAITGTNGKTTTTSLTGHILKKFYDKVFVAGNIGDPYTAYSDKTSDDSVTVLEVSSFQLETIHSFEPRVAAILNITPDHLDRHGSMKNYIAAKESITDNQNPWDMCILNYDDFVLRNYAAGIESHCIFFSSEEELNDGVYLHQNSIYFANNGTDTKVIDVTELNILGKHNYENAMAAIAICLCMDVPMDIIREGLRTFTAVEHRIEFVCEKNGVKYYNDSKATNPDAAIKGIEAMQWPTILIAGGYDKKSDYSEWIRAFGKRVKHMILIGQTANDIAQCAKSCGFNNYSIEETFEEAINSAKSMAAAGDCVLLSPACASWGMFKDFEERGNIFKELVRGA